MVKSLGSLDQLLKLDINKDFDINNPNNVARVGDKFGFDYFIKNFKSTLFTQGVYKIKNLETYIAAEGSFSTFHRDGVNQIGIFPNNSKGKSEIKNFTNYAFKTGLSYKITGHHYLTANAAILTQAPNSRDAFVSPRSRNSIINNLQNELLYTGDVNYIARFSKFKMRLTYYYTERKNALWSRSFYHDEYNTFVNFVMTDVDYLHQGMELGINGNLTKRITGNAVLALGQHLYDSRPIANVYRDNTEEVLLENSTIYLQNYKVGGMPQSAASLGLNYRSNKYWMLGVDLAYYRDIYLDPNPGRRTAEAVQNYVNTDPQWNEILGQTRLDDGYALNLFFTKSYRIKGKNFLRLNANINNATNNRNFRTGGFEQLRYDTQVINKFPPRYGYMYGFNYFLMGSYQF